jgi:hypothetical protein
LKKADGFERSQKNLKSKGSILNKPQLLRYEKDGFLVIPNFFTNETAQQLRKKEALIL